MEAKFNMAVADGRAISEALRSAIEADDAAFYLGANTCASDDLRQLTEAELGGAGQAPGVVAPKTLVPSGETRDIHRAGGRYLTLVGSNPLFHLPQDRWPHAVDADAVTRVAAAAAALVVKLTR